MAPVPEHQDQTTQQAAQAPYEGDAQPQQDRARWSDFTIVSRLILDIGGEEYEAGELAARGQKPWHAPYNYSRTMQVTPEQERIMRGICLDAVHKVDDWDSELEKLEQEADEAHRAGRKDQDQEIAAKWASLKERRPRIYQDAIANLKKSLGEETFNKVRAGEAKFVLDPGWRGNVEESPESKPTLPQAAGTQP
jgi:hypothetical protein